MPPRTEDQWEEMRKNASESILSAALELFKEKGFHGASMEQIAKRAKVSKGLAYNYFKSKDDLLAAVLERRFDETEALMEGIEKISGAHNKLKTLLDRLFASVDKDPELYKLYMTMFLQPDAPPAIRKAGKNSKKIQEQWAKIFKIQRDIFAELGMQDPDMEVIYFRSLTTGMVTEYAMEPKSYPLQKMKELVLKKYQPKKA